MNNRDTRRQTYTWGDFVEVHTSDECPEIRNYHGLAEYNNGLRGIVKTIDLRNRSEHIYGVELTNFSKEHPGKHILYFHAFELQLVADIVLKELGATKK